MKGKVCIQRFASLIMSLGLLAGITPNLRGEPITFRATGTVNATNHPQIAIGDPFTVTYTFESTTPDAYPQSPILGRYYGAGVSATMQFGPVAADFGGFWIEIMNDQIPGVGGFLDRYRVYIQGSDSMIELIAYDHSTPPDLVTSDQLSSVPPPILPYYSTNFARLMDTNTIIYPGDPDWGLPPTYAHAQGPVTQIEVFVVTPETLTEDLTTTVTALVDNGLVPENLARPLFTKLDNALAAMTADNADQREDATQKILAFINMVEAQRGKKISDQDADILVAQAEEIIALLL